MNRFPLEDHYKAHVKKELFRCFSYKNIMQVPRLCKIVISMGFGPIIKDKNLVDYCMNSLQLLSGQKPVFTIAKKSISNFKIRRGYKSGGKVTLRGHRMFDFFYRLIHISLPKTSDFRGLKKKADGKGSYSFGIKDQTIFPEIDLDGVQCIQGMNVTIVTSARTDEECVTFLQLMGLPLKK